MTAQPDRDPDAVVEAEWIAAGLYDPADEWATGRLELLRWIADHGISTEQMVAAADEGQLSAVVGDLALRPGPRYTVVEVAAQTGLSVDRVLELRRSIGFPPAGLDERVSTDGDLRMFDMFRIAGGFFSEAELVHFTRVMGSSLRRIAEAAAEMFLRDVEAPMDRADPTTELAIAQANLAAVELAGSASGVFDPMFRGHLELAVSNSRRAMAGTPGYESVPMTIGFVDLDGFTTHTARLAPQQLVDLVNLFEATALDLVGERGGRLIKLIGDEVMFSSVDPADACAIAGHMVDAAATWGSSARGGIAYGMVIPNGGDLYGVTVNLASRIADIAVAGEVLVNDAVVEHAPRIAFAPAGRRQLKGFTEPVPLWSLTGSLPESPR